MKRIFISAGDPSGDIHAARLMKALQEQTPSIEFVGIGGENMVAQGLNTLAPFGRMSVVGFWEVAKNYKFFRSVLNECTAFLRNNRVEAFIPVDYPGFNIRLAKIAKVEKIPVIYYIAPQLWAWGKDRAESLRDFIDLLLVVFPFEVDIFKEYGINVEFVGHPLLDDDRFIAIPASPEERPYRVAMLPGSRLQEVKKHIPLFSAIADELKTRLPGISIGIASKGTAGSEIYDLCKKGNTSWEVFTDSGFLMRSSQAGLIKTGTSNLEAALCGLPFSMIYMASPLTYHIGKRIVNLPYISLVNILSGKTVIKEFIQNEINKDKIASEIVKLITDENSKNNILKEFDVIRKMLGGSGASQRAAAKIKEMAGL